MAPKRKREETEAPTLQNKAIDELKKSKRKLVRKKNKKLKTKLRKEDREEHAEAARVVIGFDISLTSPALCIWDTASKKIDFLAFVQTKTKQTSAQAHYDGKNIKTEKEGMQVQIHLLSKIEYESSNKKLDQAKNKEYCQATVNRLKVDQIFTRVDQILGFTKPEDVCAVFENYAFDTEGTLAYTAEFTALFKDALVRRNIRFHCAAPTQLKKLFTGHGKATKYQIWNLFSNLLPETELATQLHPFYKNWKKNKESGLIDVPQPHEDLADAFMIAYTATH